MAKGKGERGSDGKRVEEVAEGGCKNKKTWKDTVRGYWFPKGRAGTRARATKRYGERMEKEGEATRERDGKSLGEEKEGELGEARRMEVVGPSPAKMEETKGGGGGVEGRGGG